MSMKRRTSSTISMTRSLARSSSVSLVLPLAGPQRSGAVLYTLRRVQSAIPAVECAVVPSGNADDNEDSFNKGNHQQVIESAGPAGNNGDGGEPDCYYSDYASCSSSIADLFDVLDEPQRVSKEILRSVSLSFQWLKLPFHDFGLPTHDGDTTAMMVTSTSLRGSTGNATEGKPAAVITAASGGAQRFACIHECRTGESLVNHLELRTAMDSLLHWTMQVPRNCCLSYRHDVTGELATLPWPDLEAGGTEEIEEFVSTVNRVEGKPAFFSRYERSPIAVPKSLSTIPHSSTAMEL